MVASRVRHVRVADTLASDLRSRVLRGEFAEGLLPTQHQLARESGVGLTSAREALRILEAEGLISVRRGNQGGAEVRTPTASSTSFSLGLMLQSQGTSLEELSSALRAFEPHCARLCAGSPSREDVARRLQDLNDAAAKLVDDEQAFTHCARLFHATMVEACGNGAVAVVVQSLVALWTAQEDQWAKRMNEAHSYPEVGYREEVVAVHGRITDAIAQGDEDGAERLAKSHLHASQLYVMADGAPRGVQVT